jgi:hypothetical protein
MEILRKRNTGTTVYFPMIEADATDFITSGVWTPVSGDVQYSIDGGAFTTTSGSLSWIGNGYYSLPLDASELTGEVTVVTVIDSATKVVEDQSIIITTYGDDDSQLSLNTIADYLIRRTFQNAADSADGDTKTGRSLLGAIAKLVNKIEASGGTLTVYEDDDTTSLFTQTITTNAAADPITALDT